MSSGTKFDAGKLRYDLIPSSGLAELAYVYSFGAAKYGDRNWEKGIPYSRIIAAMERHLEAFKSRETRDAESNAHHLASVAFGCMCLMHYDVMGQGQERLDDRSPDQVNYTEYAKFLQATLGEAVAKWKESHGSNE